MGSSIDSSRGYRERDLVRCVHRDDFETSVVELCHRGHVHTASEVAAVANGEHERIDAPLLSVAAEGHATSESTSSAMNQGARARPEVRRLAAERLGGVRHVGIDESPHADGGNVHEPASSLGPIGGKVADPTRVDASLAPARDGLRVGVEAVVDAERTAKIAASSLADITHRRAPARVEYAIGHFVERAVAAHGDEERPPSGYRFACDVDRVGTTFGHRQVYRSEASLEDASHLGCGAARPAAARNGIHDHEWPVRDAHELDNVARPSLVQGFASAHSP